MHTHACIHTYKHTTDNGAADVRKQQKHTYTHTDTYTHIHTHSLTMYVNM